MTNRADVTLVQDAIHNPAEPRHFMRVTPAPHTVTASVGGFEIARSGAALKLREVGFDIYDPVVYFPRGDVLMERLRPNTKTTHCPLKGDTEYFDLALDDRIVENAAWSYNRPFEFARDIADLIAFDTRRVQIVEHTASG